MPRFLERKLKARYGADSAVPYKIMNAIGAMRGNKITAKGKAMERKHEADVSAGRKPKAKRPMQHEAHAYNWRSRVGLKRGR